MNAPALRLIVLAALLALCVIGATGLGSSFIGPNRVIAALLGDGARMDTVIVWTLRLPRVALAVAAGMALGLAGAILQRALRNPMAAPSILGITDGAALGVVTFLWLFSDEANVLTVSIQWQPLAAIIGVVSDADRYFAGQEPWALKKTDPERMATVLYVTAEVVRQVAILLQPAMPESAAKLLDLVAVPETERTFAHLGEAGRLKPGTPLEKPAPVFPRYVAPEE